MPISSPGYFPPQRSNGSIIGTTAGLGTISIQSFMAGQNTGRHTHSDRLILIGDNCYAGSPDDAPGDEKSGMIAIGAQALSAVTNTESNTSRSTVVGDQAGMTLTDIGASVLIGGGVLQTFAGSATQNICIGEHVGNALVNTGGGQFNSNTIVGTFAMEGSSTPALTITGNVIVGPANLRFPSANVQSCIVLGQNNSQTGAANAVTVIGSFNSVAGSDAIVIGSNLTLAAANTSSTLIGRNALLAATAQLAIGSSAGLGLSGDLAAGNIAVGTADGDFGGANSTNVLKLMNGTIGTTNPTGGGYFYVSAGALHWVGSGGTDTTVAPA